MLELGVFVAFFVVWTLVKDFQISRERVVWNEERQMLLNRIQHPTIVPTLDVEREVEVVEPDEISLVGVVVE